jgi:peptide/nickel transport system permease protein
VDSRTSRWAGVLRTPLGLATAVLTAAMLVLAVVAPLLWADDARVDDTDNMLSGPSAEHWAGTDHLGRDILYRTLVATRLSFQLALSATAIMVVVGLVLGTAPLLLGRRAGRVVTAAVNIAVAFPGLLLALFFAVVFGVGATGAMLAIGLAGAPAFARLVQTLVAGIASRDYIAAARVAGVPELRIVQRHVLPNIAEPLIVNATIGAGTALLAFAGLSFLGLGVQAPAYDWGRLLYEGIGSLYVNTAAALVPGAAVLLAGLVLNLFGESVAKAVGVRAATDLLPPRRTRTAPPVRPASPAPAAEEPSRDALLDVRELAISFPGPSGPVPVVRGVTFSVQRGESVGIVGESGSGKSLTALAVSRLVDDLATVTAERLHFDGADLQAPDSAAQRRLLGTSLAMVFQDPMTSLNPTRRVGEQLAEVARHHQGMTRREALARAVDRLGAVRIHDPERRAHQYPHEFSGGMRQRAMIGMGLMGSPQLIVADEPTTALDVTVQQQVLDLLQAIREADDVALVLISHDVTVVADVCDRVLVMYAGRIVEDLPAAALATEALHPYTRALVAAVPTMDTDLDRPLVVIPGRPVDPAALPVGCAYADRCPLASARCREEDPPLVADEHGARVACWHAGEPIDLELGTRVPVEAEAT